MVVPRVKSSPKDAPTEPMEQKKKEKWTTIGCKDKASSAPNKTYATTFFVLPIQIGSKTSSLVGLMTVSPKSNPIDSQVSHCVYLEGIKVDERFKLAPTPSLIRYSI